MFWLKKYFSFSSPILPIVKLDVFEMRLLQLFIVIPLKKSHSFYNLNPSLCDILWLRNYYHMFLLRKTTIIYAKVLWMFELLLMRPQNILFGLFSQAIVGVKKYYSIIDNKTYLLRIFINWTALYINYRSAI